MKILLSHPTGNANVRAAAAGFDHAGMLGGFRTAIATFPGGILDKLSGINLFAELKRRKFDTSYENITKTYPWFELARVLSLKAHLHSLLMHETGTFSVDKVYQGFDNWVADNLKSARQQDIKAVYAYEDGALATFLKAKELGLNCLYDLPIGYWQSARKLLSSEIERWPDWAPTLTGFKDSAAKLARKDKELELADQIFVASSFTASTLKDFDGKLAPVHVIPYGFPPVSNGRIYEPVSKSRPLKVLFVGGLSQRKGIADLFAVVDRLKKHLALTVVGNKASFDCAVLDEALKKHTWIPSLPHYKVLELMQQHDVLVFPSLFEGFGLVITEAMSQGTPVITTDRTAGPDLIANDENGWLIKAGSTESLQQALEEILTRPEKIEKAGRAAMQTALERPWKLYEQELASKVLTIYGHKVKI